MATAVYYLMARHMEPLKRSDHKDMAQYFIDSYVKDTFTKLHWKHDVFDAEYLTKKTEADREYEAVIQTLSRLRLNKKVLAETSLHNREYVLKQEELEKKDVVSNLRKRFYEAKRT
ncbi:MAG: hypothetical protein NC123_20390 [Butyrivibrio sp.]|nr:hypothetical protein [Butyrivibrio sp.]